MATLDDVVPLLESIDATMQTVRFLVQVAAVGIGFTLGAVLYGLLRSYLIPPRG